MYPISGQTTAISTSEVQSKRTPVHTHKRNATLTLTLLELDSTEAPPPPKTSKGSPLDLCLSIGGIYGSFLTWALLQERISASGYGPFNEVYRGSLIINTIQSFLAMIIGFLYMKFQDSRKTRHAPYASASVKPSSIWKELLVVGLSQSLASPFGYASLKYVNYLTLLLAKSCKLIPVMAIHLVYYRRKFPIYKYVVVSVITAGVLMFTYFKQSDSQQIINSSTYATTMGLGLLAINLLLDGITNSTQDNIFHHHPEVSGPEMMFKLNAVSTALTTSYLLLSFSTEYFFNLQSVNEYAGALLDNQIQDTLQFVEANGTRVLLDIVLFGLCGAFGQLFIFHTLQTYGSLILVTVTVTRKMFSMLLSVIWFNHTLSIGQWAGVLAVFTGIGVEAGYKYKQEQQKKRLKDQ